MRRAIATVSMSGTLREKLEAIAAAELPRAEIQKIRDRLKPVVDKYAKRAGEATYSQLTGELTNTGR